MKRNKREYDDDDGRTVADMSGISGQNLYIPRFGTDKDRTNAVGGQSDADRESQKTLPKLTKSETRWAVLGALKAAILIYIPFLIGIGAVIAFMYFFW